MPRPKSAVKRKASNSANAVRSIGAVDLHFHGAFGIDLMSAAPERLDELARKLWEHGVAAFCPTTLSVPAPALEEAAGRIGRWIRAREKSPPGAIPLGIHLEGPFISPEACGAHPTGALRPLDFAELERLWKSSAKTLKILTVAPECLEPGELKKLVRWARPKGVKLSLGHSRATEAQATEAFDAGFEGVTHAWNALGFHQRAPGPLGAALGRKGIHVELIIDQAHVDPTVIRWTRALHPELCFVSDCVPAAGLGGKPCFFGPLEIRFREGACRVASGHLAGGGYLLPEAYGRWLAHEARETGRSPHELLKRSLPSLTELPLRYLGVPAVKLRARSGTWKLSGKLSGKATPSLGFQPDRRPDQD